MQSLLPIQLRTISPELIDKLFIQKLLPDAVLNNQRHRTDYVAEKINQFSKQQIQIIFSKLESIGIQNQYVKDYIKHKQEYFTDRNTGLKNQYYDPGLAGNAKFIIIQNIL